MKKIYIKLIFFMFLFVSGCVTQTYYNDNETRAEIGTIEWENEFVGKTVWSKEKYGVKGLKEHKLEPLIIKKIELEKINIYDRNGAYLYPKERNVIVTFSDENNISNIVATIPFEGTYASKRKFENAFYWRSPYTKIHPEWSWATWNSIKAGKPAIGMTKEQVEWACDFELTSNDLDTKFVSGNYVKETYELAYYGTNPENIKRYYTKTMDVFSLIGNRCYFNFLNGVLESCYYP